MKFLFPIALCILFISCKDLDIKKVEYHTTTMMGKTTLSVSADSVIVKFNGRGEPTYFARVTKDSEWEGVKSALESVDLKSIAELEAPSNKRATDAAAFAKFQFITKDSTFISAGFDDKNPNEALMPLMKEIERIQAENKR